MIQELLRLAGRAAVDPAFLAYHLQRFDIATICERLQCSVTTALLVSLSSTPGLESWRPDVERLAEARGVDARALAALLRDAEAIRLPHAARHRV